MHGLECMQGLERKKERKKERKNSDLRSKTKRTPLLWGYVIQNKILKNHWITSGTYVHYVVSLVK